MLLRHVEIALGAGHPALASDSDTFGTQLWGWIVDLANLAGARSSRRSLLRASEMNGDTDDRLGLEGGNRSLMRELLITKSARMRLAPGSRCLRPPRCTSSPRSFERARVMPSATVSVVSWPR